MKLATVLAFAAAANVAHAGTDVRARALSLSLSRIVRLSYRGETAFLPSFSLSLTQQCVCVCVCVCVVVASPACSITHHHYR